MKVTKLYIGSETGSNAEVKKTFSKEEIIRAIECTRSVYNQYNIQWEGYTLYTTDGYWNGVQETSYVLEVMDSLFNGEYVANFLKSMLSQDSVMVTVQELQVEFI